MNNCEIKIRKIRESDAEPISEIFRDMGWFEYIQSESLEQTSERVKKHIALCCSDESHSVYVAETGKGDVVGYVARNFLYAKPELCLQVRSQTGVWEREVSRFRWIAKNEIDKKLIITGLRDIILNWQ